MNTQDIEHFLAVADSRTLSAAAQQLRIAQPTLTKSIARLERALGTRLFERTASGMALTEGGRVFAGHARDIHARLEDASAAMRDLRGGRAGAVRIGLGIGIPQALMAATFRPLMQQGVTVEIIGGTPVTFATLLLNGEIDFAVAGSGFGGAGQLRWKPLFRDPLLVAAPVGHPLARKPRVSWPELAEQAWLVPPTGSEARAWFDQQFYDRGIALPRTLLALRDISLSLDLSAELGACRLLARSLLGNAEGRRYRRLALEESEEGFDRVVGLIWRGKGYLSPTAERLMRQVEVVARHMEGVRA
ncbi:LysR family transcriptional regulator [Belnapia sp. T6]|uniref:LysR family transcriptional regulator n=1 Tax=Belnapia mucosa TaxID=2804532 RepID=A0ABS1V9B8_9PROT|nr:LysR family transcriptional regulator [Belnapia mucosa]MBL6458240.1 LysR family transcriptional regulator [Belnapia mucosa]